MRGPIYIAGPTASGKSAFAIELARRVSGEIISVDSMQVYRGMDIGTAKVSAAERELIPHHLIDVAEVNEPFDVARFLTLAKAAEAEIIARGNVPIYCGGTGLYFKALVAGVGASPPADPALRQELDSTPVSELLEELRLKDAETFERIDRSNPRRVVRALEVIRLTGRKFSEQRAEWRDIPQTGEWIGLLLDRAELNRRIDRRVEEMFAEGLVAEGAALLGRGLRDNRTATQSLGYRQVMEHLDGKLGLKETIELVKLKTRQFAKRQMTWFRHQLVLNWLTPSECRSFLDNYGQANPR